MPRRRAATAPGSCSPCCSTSICRFFSRSTSDAGNVGRWTTSAKIANAGRGCASAPRSRSPRSRAATPPSSVTPRSPSALSIASAERVFVPRSIVRIDIAAVPGCAGRIGDGAGAGREADRHLRQVVALDDVDLEAVLELRRLHRRARRTACRRRTAAASSDRASIGRRPARGLREEAHDQAVRRVEPPLAPRPARRRPSARGSAPRSASNLPGSPRKVLYWFSRSALPPKPPMRSRPEMNWNSCLVLARSSSAWRRPGPGQQVQLTRDHLLDLGERTPVARRGDDQRSRRRSPASRSRR